MCETDLQIVSTFQADNNQKIKSGRIHIPRFEKLLTDMWNNLDILDQLNPFNTWKYVNNLVSVAGCSLAVSNRNFNLYPS